MNPTTNRWMWMLGLLVGAMLLAFGLAGEAAAATYYVRKTGNDNNSGTSPSSAYRTFNKAISKASAGSIVYVGAGTYSENFSFSRSGSSSTRNIQYIADTTGTKTGDAGSVILADTSGAALSLSSKSYISFSGFTVSGATQSVFLSSCSNISFTNCVFQNATTQGLYLSSSTSVKFAGCSLSGSSGIGMWVLGTGSTVTFSNGTIRSTGNTGVSMASSGGTLTLDHTQIQTCGGATGTNVGGSAGTLNVICCLITNTGTGISFTGTQANLWSNTLSTLSSTGITVFSNATIRNNILASVTTGVLRGGGTLTHGYNLYWGNTTNYSGCSAATGDVVGDPKFTSATDFRPTNFSASINVGTDASSTHTSDLAGFARPFETWDIGCYEYGATVIRKKTFVGWTQAAPQ